MTVAELIEDLKKCPQDAEIYAEDERADKVTIEGYDELGNHKKGWAKIVRIIKGWDCEMVLGSARLYADVPDNDVGKKGE